MSTSYVYALKQKYSDPIPPRREEEFIAFLGKGIYEKSHRIYEMEQEAARERKRKHDEEAPLREARRQEELEQQRKLKQEKFEARRRERELALEERLKEMESQKVSGQAVISEEDAQQVDKIVSTAPPGDTEKLLEEIDNISLSDAAAEEKLAKFQELLERSKEKKPAGDSSGETDKTEFMQEQPDTTTPDHS